MPATDYLDIKGRANLQYNVGGFAYFLYARKSEITTLPDQLDIEDGAAVAVSEFVEVADDMLFATGKGFRRMNCTLKKGTGKGSNTAEQDATGYEPIFEGFVSGLNKQDLGLLQVASADELIVLGVTMDGKYVRIGGAKVGAFVKIDLDIATMGGGVRGTKVTISSFDVGPVIYTGAVDLAVT